jgi:integrase
LLASILVRTALATAMRRSELFALRWKDFDATERTFTIRETVYRGVIRPFTKTTETGTDRLDLLKIALPDVLSKELNGWRGYPAPGVAGRLYSDDNDFIFVGPEGMVNAVYDSMVAKASQLQASEEITVGSIAE